MEKHNYIFDGTDNRNTNIRVPIVHKVEPSLFGAFIYYYYDADLYKWFSGYTKVECDFFPTAFSLQYGRFEGERSDCRALVAADSIVKAALMSLKLVVR